ncbi:MAG: hypothetical protein LBS53_00455 [Synergistaceae bacterium]|jgi:hypothetical protein|nr:hypothetical protein [Synergistaceae bacterium]
MKVKFTARLLSKKMILLSLAVLMAGSLFVMRVRAADEHLQAPARQEVIYENFRDIPGVTEEEAEAIEKLRGVDASFVFGMEPSAECFLRRDGSMGGLQRAVLRSADPNVRHSVRAEDLRLGRPHERPRFQ